MTSKHSALSRRRGLAKEAAGAFACRQLRRKESLLNRPQQIDYLEFVPPVQDAAEYADLSARINWYLPEQARALPIFLEESDSWADPDPRDAQHMDPALVRQAGWAPSRPAGRAHIVVHRSSSAGAAKYLSHPRSATFAAHEFHYAAEEAWFLLHRAFCSTVSPGGPESIDKLMTKSKVGGSALVLATGPSAKYVDPAAVSQDLRITCNSAVRDRELLQALKPDVIAFSDPVFHAGPSRYAASFREDLMHALSATDAIFLTSHLYVLPIIAHHPELVERLAVVEINNEPDWRWPTRTRPTTRLTGNVLTNLMLPAAFALAETAVIAGCDGRDPSEKYFWTHNARTQYSDELMQAAFDAHPAFFRNRDYGDYYAEHCRTLEELLSMAESRGKHVRGLTESFIPALRERGAPKPS